MSDYVLLDTDVYSYLSRGDPRGAGFQALEADLERHVVLGYDFALARTCGELLAARESVGQRMEELDAWIAATALRHDIPLATNNRKHFDGIPGLVFAEPGT